MDMRYKLRCLGYAEVDDDIWFASLYFNGLIQLDRRTGQIKSARKFPDYGISHVWLYATVCQVKEYIICVPFQSEKIVSYNIQTQKFQSFALDLEKVGKRQRYYASAFVYGKYVYMFPVEAKCMIRFDVQKNSIKYLDNGLTLISEALPEKAECFVLQHAIVNKKVYIPFAGLNAVAVFEPEKECLDIEYLNIDDGCSTINYHAGFFYMASWKACKIYRWDYQTGDIMTFDTFPKNFIPGEYSFWGTYVIGKQIFYLPVQANMIVSLDTDTGDLCEGVKISNSCNEIWNTFSCKMSNGKVYVNVAGDDDFCILEYGDGKRMIQPYSHKGTLPGKDVISDFLLDYQYYDSMVDRIRKYIQIIAGSNEKVKSKKTNNYGRLIWKTM